MANVTTPLVSLQDTKLNLGSGSLGIGVNPGTILHVKGSDPVFTMEDTSAPGTARIQALNGSLILQSDVSAGVANSIISFKIDDTEHARFNSDGNLGIGTTSPDVKLEVSGSTANSEYAHFANNNQRHLKLSSYEVNSNVNAGHDINASSSVGALSLSTGGTKAIYIDSSQRVGVGTTSPTRALTVGNTSSATGNVINLTSSTSGYVQIAFGDSDDDNKSQILYDNNTDNLTFQTGGGSTFNNGKDRLVIDNTGNVGIGTTSPSQRLHISSGQVFSDDNANANGPNFVVNTTNKDAAEYAYVAQRSGSAAGGILIGGMIRAAVGSTASPGFSFTEDANTGINRPAADTMAFSTGGSERMRITSSGDVGIGTTSPNAKLEISGDTRSGGRILYGGTESNYLTGVSYASIYGTADTFESVSGLFGSLVLQSRSNTDRPIIFVTGATPSEKMRLTAADELQVTGNGVIKNQESGGNYSYLQQTSSNARLFVQYSQPLLFGTAATERMSIESGGNVKINNKLGVGKSPGVPLDVMQTGDSIKADFTNNVNANFRIKTSGANVQVGPSTASDLEIQTTNTTRLTIDSGGNVGIGTTSPGAKLHVNSTDGILHSGDEFYSWVRKTLDIQNPSSSTENYILIATTAETNVRFEGTIRGARASGVSAVGGGMAEVLFVTNSSTSSPLRSGGVRSISSDVANYGHPIFELVKLTYNSTTYYALRITYSSSWVSSFNHLEFDGVANNVLFTNLGTGDVSNVTDFDGTDAIFSYRHAKVGIGTTSPDTILHVRSANELNARFESTDSGSRILIKDNDTNTYINAADGVASIGQNAGLNASNLNILSNGSVGIGTTSPNSAIHIIKAITGDSSQLRIGNDNGAELRLGITGTGANEAAHIKTNSGENLEFQIGQAANATSPSVVFKSGGGIQFGAYGVGTFTGTTAKVLAVDSSGNVIETNAGSGTVTSSAATTNYVAKWTNGGSEILGNSLIYDNGTNVGIGTTSPQYKLDVAGTINSSSAIYAADVVVNGVTPTITLNDTDGDANAATAWVAFQQGGTGIGKVGDIASGRSAMMLYAESGKELMFFTNGQNATSDTPAITINTSQNVGIATANPKARMQVVTTSDTSGTPTTYDDNGKYFTVGQGGETGGNVFISYDNTNNRGYIGALSPSVAWRNLILNPGGGNVGIGTSSPDAHLHIEKSAGTTTVLTEVAANSTVGYEIKKTGATTQHWKIVDGQTVNGTLEFYDATDSLTRMAINGNGNVGIGTTNPVQKLHITGSTLITNNNYHYGYTSGGSQATLVGITSSNNLILSQNNANIANTYIYGGTGNINLNPAGDVYVNGASLYVDDDVQIGATSTPDLVLKSSGTGVNTNGKIYWKDSGGTVRASAGYETGSTEFFIDNTFSGGLYLKSNGTVGLTVNSAANVGIGTTSPSFKLHVNGGGARIEDGETTLSPDSTGSSGISSRALTILNLVDTAWTADALTAYNATTSYDILNRASYSFFARPKSTNIITHCTEVNDNAHLYRFVNLNSSATEPLLRWSFYQYDGSGTASSDFKVANQLFEIQHDGSTQLMVQGDGNVGIGTNTPDYKLDVEGGLRVYQNTSAVGAGMGLTVENAGTGDAVVQYLITGVQRWVTGIDNSDSDKFKIAKDTDVGVNTYLTIQTDGNVGIGTASPERQFHVLGGTADNSSTTIMIGGSTNHTSKIELAETVSSGSMTHGFSLTTDGGSAGDGTNNFLLRNHSANAAGNVAFSVERINGYVGINTAIPSYKLDVNGDVRVNGSTSAIDANYGVFLGTYSGGTSISPGELVLATQAKTGWGPGDELGRIRFWLGDASGVGRRDVAKIVAVNESGDGSTTTTAGGALAFYTSSYNSNVAERVRIKQDGNVGIGTTSPLAKLHVSAGSQGGILLDPNTALLGKKSTDSTFTQLIYWTGDIAYYGRATTAPASHTVSQHQFRTGGTTRLTLTTAEAIFNDGGFNYDFRIEGDTDTALFKADASADRVGIGTASPERKLHVFKGESGGATSNSDSSLVLENSSHTYLQFLTPTTSESGLLFGDNDNDRGALTYSHNNDSMNFRVAASTRMFINSSGNVGIGTITPGYKLEVNGDFAATSKSFVIDHPTKPNKKLRYASLEGPENGVYIRGRGDSDVIELPDYWTGLVHDDSITVQITAIGKDSEGKVRTYSVNDIVDNKVYIYTDSKDEVYNYFYIVNGERKDINKLEVEIDK